jgi:HAD superfamily hydrolase (TIGR01509 family)
LARPTIFLDDGGVISDNAVRRVQWRRLLAEYLVPRLGGTPDAWIAANTQIIAGSFAEGGYGDHAAYVREVGALRDAAFEAAQRASDIAWLRNMCRLVGVPPPADDGDCWSLAREVSDFVCARVSAAFPDVVDAVRALHAAGFVLLTASGERSFELDGYLRALAIRDCFADQLFGADLLGVPKTGPGYYARIFARLNLAPTEALIVDDSPLAIAWATAAGARALLLDRSTAPSDPSTIESLTQLLDVISS